MQKTASQEAAKLPANPPKKQKKNPNLRRKLKARMQPETNLTKQYQSVTDPNLMQVDNSKNPFECPTYKKMILSLRDLLNFYFGDSNLCKDKFLKEILKKGT